MNILAQVFGIIGLIFLIVSVQNNNKVLILIFQIFANIFYGLQYLTLGLFSAGLMSCVSLIRCLIFFYFEKKRGIITPIYWLIILTIVPIIISCFTFTGWISLIPIIATILYTYAIWQKNLTRFRVIVSSSSIGWIFYNFVGGAYVSLIGGIFEFISGIIAIIRFDIFGKKHNEKVLD